MLNKPMLELRNISLFRGSRKIIDNVSLDVRSGELVGLIGPNGAGKSTLLRVMANLARPDCGTLQLGGEKAVSLAPQIRARKLAYLAQGEAPDTPMSAELIVALGRLPHHRGQANAADNAAIERAMAATLTVELRKRTFNTLSGGEKLRVLLARALAVEAPLLLADEPVSALDPFHQLQILHLFRALGAQNKSIVVVLHDLTLASRFCDRLLLMNEGQIIAEGSPAKVLGDKNLAHIYRISAIRGEVSGADYVVPWDRIP